MSVVFSRGLILSSSSSSGSGSGSAVPSTDEKDAMISVGNAPSSSSIPHSASHTTMKPLRLPHPPGLGATERELEHFLRDALSSCILLERYPRCVIQVVIQIVQADGSVLGSALNCAVLALMDAGIAMKGLPIASTCVVIGEYEKEEGGCHDRKVGTTIWLDPTAEEESGEGHATVVLVTDMSAWSQNASILHDDDDDDNDDSGGIITSMMFGAPISMKGLLVCAEATKQSSAATVAFMRLAIEQKVQRESQTLWS